MYFGVMFFYWNQRLMITKQSYNRFILLFLFLFCAFISKATSPELIIISNENGTLTAKISSQDEFTVYVLPLFQKVPEQQIIKAKAEFTVKGLSSGEHAITFISKKGEVNTVIILIN